MHFTTALNKNKIAKSICLNEYVLTQTTWIWLAKDGISREYIKRVIRNAN